MDTDTSTSLAYTAKVDPLADSVIRPDSWFITHGLGGPAAGMFTEVRFIYPSPEQPEHVLDEIVRKVAFACYGTSWAFHYRPNQYKQAIQNERFSLTRREVVIVSSIEVWD